MLDFIYYPVSALLWFWHKVFGFLLVPDSGIAWALSVMFLVFTLRALLIKPFLAQMRSMRAMQHMAPELAELRERYKDDRQRFAAEAQKLQTKHGVNPLGGCLPMLVVVPVFIGLIGVLRGFTPGATSNYVFNAQEVGSFVDANLFGARLSMWINMPAEQLAQFGTDRVSVVAVAVPLMVLAAIATHLTARHSAQRQRANPAAVNSSQTVMMSRITMYVFPLGVIVGGLFFRFPIAVLLYWLTNNAWTLGQQWLIHRTLDSSTAEVAAQPADEPTPEPRAPKPGAKPGNRKRKRKR